MLAETAKRRRYLPTCRWRQKYGGMDPAMAKQFRELEKENARLKRLVADQALDNQILKEAARPNL